MILLPITLRQKLDMQGWIDECRLRLDVVKSNLDNDDYFDIVGPEAIRPLYYYEREVQQRIRELLRIERSSEDVQDTFWDYVKRRPDIHCEDTIEKTVKSMGPNQMIDVIEYMRGRN